MEFKIYDKKDLIDKLESVVIWINKLDLYMPIAGNQSELCTNCKSIERCDSYLRFNLKKINDFSDVSTVLDDLKKIFISSDDLLEFPELYRFNILHGCRPNMSKYISLKNLMLNIFLEEVEILYFNSIDINSQDIETVSEYLRNQKNGKDFQRFKCSSIHFITSLFDYYIKNEILDKYPKID